MNYINSEPWIISIPYLFSKSISRRILSHFFSPIAIYDHQKQQNVMSTFLLGTTKAIEFTTTLDLVQKASLFPQYPPREQLKVLLSRTAAIQLRNIYELF